MTVVQLLLRRSSRTATPRHVLLVDLVAAAVVVAIVIVQVTVGGRHRLITTGSGRTSNIVPMMRLVVAALRFAFLFHLQLLAEDGGDFALHERPRYRRVGQRALLTTRTVHLGARALSFDALAAAGEAELVMPDGGALHEVRVFQPFLAEGTFECRIRCGSRGRSTGCAVRCGTIDSRWCSGSYWAWSDGTSRSAGTGRTRWSGDAVRWRLRTGL